MSSLFIHGDASLVLDSLAPDSVRTCVTSPPYWGLRDYGTADQIGLEETPERYVEKMVNVFEKVKRVLTPDGTLWLNLGDSYAATMKGRNDGQINRNSTLGGGKTTQTKSGRQLNKVVENLKPKDLVGIPWRVAFALQKSGWYLRQDIIWHKPNPMPESVKDRCTKAHEYIFLLSKSPKYFFNANAIKEPSKEFLKGGKRDREKFDGESFVQAKQRGWGNNCGVSPTRQKRSVWTVSTKPYKGAHFATFPPDLIEPCVLSGSEPGDIVLDPFSGAGTSALVATRHKRRFIGIELNPDYIKLAEARLANQS